MRINKLTKWTAVLTLALPVLLMAQRGDEEGGADKSGSVAFKFLNLHYDARGAALGGLVAQAAGAEALYWNPAGLAKAGGLGFNAGMTQWLVETSYMNAGVVMPMAGGVLGVGFVSVDYGDFMKAGWQEVSGSYVFKPNIETFTASDNALQVSYGRFLSDKFSIGGSAKMVSESIDDASLSGLAFDVGTQFNTGYKNLQLGAVISNFGPTIDPVEENTESSLAPPMTFSFGAVGQAFGDDSMGLVAGINVVKLSDMAQRIAVNGEMTVAGMIKIRGSYTLGDLVQDALSFGAGINMAGISVNVAMTQMVAFDPVMRFSLGYQL
tara:strand:+ start:61 stop:1029 length:969 start_codon:yes stop_codon:yes gene_type:complete